MSLHGVCECCQKKTDISYASGKRFEMCTDGKKCGMAKENDKVHTPSKTASRVRAALTQYGVTSCWPSALISTCSLGAGLSFTRSRHQSANMEYQFSPR